MFTGIIREVGIVRRVRRTPSGATLEIRAPRCALQLATGGSIAVDGACLTVTSLSPDSFAGDVVPETLARTTLGERRGGERCGEQGEREKDPDHRGSLPEVRPLGKRKDVASGMDGS